MINILIVEDDKNIRKLMGIWLTKAGYCPLSAENGEEAVNILTRQKVHLLLVDIMMPVMNGTELLHYLQINDIRVPVIVTTAKESIEDKKVCFALGADDYLVKPIDREELLLRINAVLKRSNVIDSKILQIGSVTLDANTLTVSSGDKVTPMPKKEFEILFKLLSDPNKVYTKPQLMDEFWGYDSDSFTDTVKVHINRIRQKIEPYPEIGVRTIRGVGYKGDIHVRKE